MSRICHSSINTFSRWCVRLFFVASNDDDATCTFAASSRPISTRTTSATHGLRHSRVVSLSRDIDWQCKVFVRRHTDALFNAVLHVPVRMTPHMMNCLLLCLVLPRTVTDSILNTHTHTHTGRPRIDLFSTIRLMWSASARGLWHSWRKCCDMGTLPIVRPSWSCSGNKLGNDVFCSQRSLYLSCAMFWTLHTHMWHMTRGIGIIEISAAYVM